MTTRLSKNLLNPLICLCVSLHSFELNSDVLGDEPLLSISNRFPEENDRLHNTSSPHHSPGIPVDDNSNLQSLPQWLHNSTSGELEMSKLSEQQFEETDLEKELLNQQCGELREELAAKDRQLNVLREEIIKSAEDLEEARDRYNFFYFSLHTFSVNVNLWEKIFSLPSKKRFLFSPRFIYLCES